MAESELKIVSTPTIDDHLISSDKFTTNGVLSEVCSRVVLEILYVARISRLAVPASRLFTALRQPRGRLVGTWTSACETLDRQL